jgi:cysteine desulfurase
MDAAATAKYRNVDDIIVDTMTTAMKDSWMNPSSLYASSVKDKINKCRKNIADFIGARAEEIYFTSGASESNNWAIKGWAEQTLNDIAKKTWEEDWDIKTHVSSYIIATPVEHKSILGLIGNDVPSCIVNMCEVDNFGRVVLESLERLLQTYEDEHILVTICMANNEIGTIQSIKEISDIVHKYNGVLHVDSTQAFGHIPIDVEELGIDMLSASGHKISSVLRGIGFLYKRSGVDIQPLIYGAQENGMRGGTENTYGIVGLSKALEYCDFSYEVMNEMRDKRDYFISQLESKFGCKLNGHRKCRLLNNINVTFPQNITGESLLYMLDMGGIKVSTSSACNSRAVEPSYVLKAIGLSDDDAIKSIRITLPDDITYDDINTVIDEIGKAIKIIEAN